MKKEIRYIRRLTVIFMVALFISGLTAMPAETELGIITKFFDFNNNTGRFLDHVQFAIHQTNQQFPFLAYGYDWLAFAHFILAFLFIGPYKDPVRNKWVIVFGMYACSFILPFAFIAGHFRHIPIWWRLIDCLFGVMGIIPLLLIYKKIKTLESTIKTHIL